MSSDQALHTSDFIMAPFKAQSLALCVAFVGMPCISNAKRPLRTWRLKSACKAIDAISRSLLGGILAFPNQTSGLVSEMPKRQL